MRSVFVPPNAFRPPNPFGGLGRPRPDETAPTLASATVAADGTTVTLAFSEAVTAAAWADLFSIEGTVTTLQFLQYTSGSGSATVVFEVLDPIQEGETVTLDYVGPGVEDMVGNDLANITDAAVTNNTGGEVVGAYSGDRYFGARYFGNRYFG
jgi:hypothetical protein